MMIARGTIESQSCSEGNQKYNLAGIISAFPAFPEVTYLT
jgi:hypothetical protein